MDGSYQVHGGYLGRVLRRGIFTWLIGRRPLPDGLATMALRHLHRAARAAPRSSGPARPAAA